MKKSLFITYSVFICITSYAQTTLIGMTEQGGDGFGTIFRTDANGNNQQVMQTFTPNNQGMEPGGKLCEAPNGKLYGVTYQDVLNGAGVLFEYDPSTNNYVKKIDFSSANGRNPYGSLMLASNGKLYGMTMNGGANNKGVIFEYDYPSNTYTKKIDLISADGANPGGSLVQAPNGKLYGMSCNGGANNKGVIFEYDYPSNTYIKKIDLTSADGGNPRGSLMQASNGKLYGMTGNGGANNGGVIFEYDYSSNTYTKKIDLDFPNGSNPNGSNPGGDLIQASNGKLYGMTEGGGAGNNGVIFEYDYSSNTYTKKMDFNQANGWSGNSFMQANNGKLYGTTRFGGTAGGSGVIFEYDYSTDTYTKKMDFTEINGSDPSGSLIQASNGKLYGTTLWGGIGGRVSTNGGVIFEYDYSSNIFTKKINLNFAINGSYPEGSLMQASNGKLYGVTPYGGANGIGVIFEYDYSANIYTKKIDFNTTTGYNPRSALIEAFNGKIYGMADGGINNGGVIFEYDYSTSTYTKKFNLTCGNGSSLSGSLMQASNGKLYGMTRLCGATNDGVIFEYDYSTNTYTKKIDLNSSGTGSRPVGSLVQAPNGKLYGMTGIGDYGIDPGWIFEYDYSTNTYIIKFHFSDTDGRDANGSLMLASNGKLYGMTSAGGVNDEGVIFEYDYSTNTYTKKFDLGGVNGRWGTGPLMQASNGKLYGMTPRGGTNGIGVIFEYDYSTNTYTKKLDFMGANGSNPCTNLIEIDVINITTTAVSANNCVGSSISVPYTIAGTYNASNIFTAQLSNSSGTFTSPINIGNFISDNAGSINAVIPENTIPGSGYRIRVVSSNPIVIGTDNGSSITVNPLPIITANASATTLCAGTFVTLAGGGGSSYTWTGGVPNGVGFIPITTTTYTITGTDGNGCSNTSTKTIIVNPLPTIAATASATTVCAGNSVTLIATGATSYTWSGGVTNGVGFTPTATTSYTVTGIDGNNCSNTATKTINVNPLPIVTANASAIIVCAGTSVTLTGGGASSYTWSGGVSDGLGFIPVATTTYTVTGTDGNNCSNTATETINVNSLPDITTNSSGFTIIANQTGAIYQWLNCNNDNSPISGATNQSYIAAINGNYAVMITMNGCKDTSTCVNLNTTGIEKPVTNNNLLTVFPNPSKGLLSIQSIGEGNYSLKTESGQMLQSFKLEPSNNYTINIENLSNGIYFIVGFNNNQMTNQKVVIAK